MMIMIKMLKLITTTATVNAVLTDPRPSILKKWNITNMFCCSIRNGLVLVKIAHGIRGE